MYIAESTDGLFTAADVNFNSKGAHVKKLTNGKTYNAYVESLLSKIALKPLFWTG